MSNEIVKLLINQKLRDTVVETITEVYNYAGTLHDNPTEDMEDVTENNLWDEAWWRAEIYGKMERIDEAFEKYVFNKMEKPYCIEPQEVLAKFYEMACPGSSGCPELESINFDNLYSIFVHNINLNLLSYKRSSPFPIYEMEFDKEKDSFDDFHYGLSIGLAGLEIAHQILEKRRECDNEDKNLLWRHNNMEISLSEKTSIGNQPHDRKTHLNAIIHGNLSNKVCQKMEVIVSKVLQTATKSLALLNKDIDERCLLENKVTLEQYLDAYLMGSTKKDSFEKRIHNAVHLLVESDLQTNNSIAIALSIASIEALLGEKGESISEKLSTHVATLLEPELKFRSEAKKFMKNMYNERSRTLHGSELKSEDLCRTQARHLAAGVLSSVLLRRNFKKRFGEKAETPSDLLSDLSNSCFTNGLPDGILEYNVCHLWRNKQ